MGHILIVDDNPSILEYIEDILADSGHTLVQCRDGGSALDAFYSDVFDLVISDFVMPVKDGFGLIAEIRAVDAHIPIIMITGVGGVDDAVRAIKKGANDFVVKPFQPQEFRVKVEKNLEYYSLKREIESLKRVTELKTGSDTIVGESSAMKKLVSSIKQVAGSNATIMLLGESGTGKELIARAIHEESNRKDRPFIPIDCSTLTETIIESELFGHIKGAFTGADRTKKGILEEANGGSIFLDEIGNLNRQTQSKLLRFLQEREIKPVGSSQFIKINVRIISATNVNLRKEIESGGFREDLYYRLSGIEVHVPTLRDRLEDIPYLVDHFIRKYRKDLGKNIEFIDEDALEILRHREWSGNVRELEHLVEYALIVEKTDRITANTLLYVLAETKDRPGSLSFNPDLDAAVAVFEKNHILRVLQIARNNRVQAARLLGISRSVLYEKLKRHEIE